jgi:hypothetical protein
LVGRVGRLHSSICSSVTASRLSRKGKRLGVAYASTPRGEGGAGTLKFKTK